jgi:hypothetical protein
LQALSPAVAPGSPWPDARPGDYLVTYADGSEKLCPRIPGVPVLPVVFMEKAVEWAPERGTRAPPVAHHDFVPLDAAWIKVNGKKSCIRSSNGNRIEKTVFLYALVEGFQTTFSFASTSYNIGKNFSNEAGKVKVLIDDEPVRVCGALWRLTSELERENTYTWFSPRFEKIGVLGQPSGPSLEMARLAKTLRFEVKAQQEADKAARIAASGVKPTPALGRVGSIEVTTGIGERPRSWADPRGPEVVDPKPAAEPAKTSATPQEPTSSAKPVDPKLDDSLDDLPWNK